MDVAVLIPCFNEEKTIGKVVTDFRRVLPEATIYVYDNNSTDATADEARNAGAVVRYEHRQGKGNVVRAMLRDIDAEIYLMVDGDDTYPAEDAPKMVSKVYDCGYDMVIGDRLSSTYFSENKRPFHGIGNRVVRASINAMYGAHVHDVMTGYRAFNFTFAKAYPGLSKGFEIESEMTVYALDNGLSVYEMPVEYRDRPSGSHSKLSTVRDGIKVLSMIFRLIREKKPLPFFGGLGALTVLVGLGFCTSVLMEYWATRLVPRFPTLIGACMLVMVGLLMALIGIILDVMAKNERKHHIVLENEFSWLRRNQRIHRTSASSMHSESSSVPNEHRGHTDGDNESDGNNTSQSDKEPEDTDDDTSVVD